MISAFQRFFSRRDEPDNPPEDDQLQVAAAVLLLETMRADLSSRPEERTRVFDALQEFFSLSRPDAEQLTILVEARSEETTLLFPFARRLREKFKPSQRLRLIEAMWQVVYADGELHPYEARLMESVVGLLEVDPAAAEALRVNAER